MSEPLYALSIYLYTFLLISVYQALRLPRLKRYGDGTMPRAMRKAKGAALAPWLWALVFLIVASTALVYIR